MRIAQVSPLYESVPPRRYGGTERIVHYLTEELVRLGHQVTLFASGDSETTAELMPVCEKATRLDPTCKEPIARHVLMIEQLIKQADRFDIIHSHIEYLPLLAFRNLTVPTVTTIHSRLDLPEIQELYRAFSDAPLISISDAQRKPLPEANWQGTVYHGLPEGVFVPRINRGEYLVFLGRFSPEKGPDRAIEIARQIEMPLKMSAKVDCDNREFFNARVAPLINSSSLIEDVGETNEEEKIQLLGNAYALLLPIDWPEPFGLVMIEAMACGTPVIAFNCGSVPEVIDDGVTGFIVNSIEEAVQALRKVPELDRRKCRKIFEQRFTSRRMALDYLALYQQVQFAQTGIRMVVNR